MVPATIRDELSFISLLKATTNKICLRNSFGAAAKRRKKSAFRYCVPHIFSTVVLYNSYIIRKKVSSARSSSPLLVVEKLKNFSRNKRTYEKLFKKYSESPYILNVNIIRTYWPPLCFYLISSLWLKSRKIAIKIWMKFRWFVTIFSIFPPNLNKEDKKLWLKK
jgi:hypothetical protein